MIKQILKPLNYLHRQNPPILHRDLKLQNIMVELEIVDEEDNEECETVLKLTDFGLACAMGTQGAAAKGVGTVLYMAPE